MTPHIISYWWFGPEPRVPGVASTGTVLVEAERAYGGDYFRGQRQMAKGRAFPGQGPLDAVEKFLRMHSDAPEPEALILSVVSILPDAELALSQPIRIAEGGAQFHDNMHDDAFQITTGRRLPRTTGRYYSVVGLVGGDDQSVRYRVYADSVNEAVHAAVEKANLDAADLTAMSIWNVVERRANEAVVYVPSRGTPGCVQSGDIPSSALRWLAGDYRIAWRVPAP